MTSTTSTTKARQEDQNSVLRIVTDFCKTAGGHMGVTTKTSKPVVLQEAHFKALVTEAEELLNRRWTEEEIRERIRRAHLEHQRVDHLYDLVRGAVPQKSRRDPERNILDQQTPRRYHGELQNRSMPKVQLCTRASATGAKFGATILSPATVYPVVEHYTLRDLEQYWTDRIGFLGEHDQGNETYGKFEYYLDQYNLADILWAIDQMRTDYIENDHGGRHIRVFDLEQYIQATVQESRTIVPYLGRRPDSGTTEEAV